MTRKRSEVQAELDQLSRDMSWTFGRAAREGTSLDKAVYETFATKLTKLEKELEQCKE